VVTLAMHRAHLEETAAMLHSSVAAVAQVPTASKLVAKACKESKSSRNDQIEICEEKPQKLKTRNNGLPLFLFFWIIFICLIITPWLCRLRKTYDVLGIVFFEINNLIIKILSFVLWITEINTSNRHCKRSRKLDLNSTDGESDIEKMVLAKDEWWINLRLIVLDLKAKYIMRGLFSLKNNWKIVSRSADSPEIFIIIPLYGHCGFV
jgi:hypothetical protein